MGEALQALAFGEPRPISIADLEAELGALWRSAAEDPATHHAVTRASTLTLLVYVESEEAGREVGNLVSKVTLQNPCRAVVIIAEPEATSEDLTAWVSAHCHVPAAGEKQVCCEQVTILARGEAVRDLDKVAVSLTVSGLPVYLWWRAGRYSPPRHFHEILRVTNRVFVDSARFPKPASDLSHLAGQFRASGAGAVSDLNWLRITPWRELIAQCFDSQETRLYLDRLSEVRIECGWRAGEVGAHVGQALLLAAWLASRLNWIPVDLPAEPPSDFRSFRFKSNRGSVQVQVVPRQDEGGGSGVFVSMVLKAGGASPAIFSLVRGPDGKSALTRTELPERPPIERTVRLEVLDEVELLNEELKFASRDRVYEEALSMVARMTGGFRIRG